MRRKSLRAALALAGALLLAVAASAATVTQGSLVPTGKGFAVHDEKAPGVVGESAITKASGIQYHGGPVMLGTNHVYYLWYGNWNGNSAPTILDYLAGHLGGTPYWNIETTYYQGSNPKKYVSNSLTFGGEHYDSYSQGSNLDDNAVFAVVTTALGNGGLPVDSSGVYLVLTSADVNETSGFCTQYCGWHTDGSYNGTDIKFGFIGNPDRCPSACEFIVGNAPNGNAGADGMASIISHELDEAVTDPDLNAWYFRSGNENADQCAWTFGSTFGCGGGTANINIGSRCYLIQRNWKNTSSGAGCTMHYP